jgi:hypothetical protein
MPGSSVALDQIACRGNPRLAAVRTLEDGFTNPRGLPILTRSAIGSRLSSVRSVSGSDFPRTVHFQAYGMPVGEMTAHRHCPSAEIKPGKSLRFLFRPPAVP